MLFNFLFLFVNFDSYSLVLLNQTPPIRPQMSDPFDTKNFRRIKDDGDFILTGNELSDDAIKTDKAFSKFTRGLFIFLSFPKIIFFSHTLCKKK